MGSEKLAGDTICIELTAATTLPSVRDDVGFFVERRIAAFLQGCALNFRAQAEILTAG